MEHTEGTLKKDKEIIYPQEYERASNSYLMAIVAVIVGLPLPIINTIASFGYYLSQRKSSYFVRRHCIQALLAQTVMIPFNSIAFGWTIGKIITHISIEKNGRHYTTNFDFIGSSPFEDIPFYWAYIAIIIVLNITEFIAVMVTAARVRNGHNVRWFILAGITDRLCSRENRDPYKI